MANSEYLDAAHRQAVFSEVKMRMARRTAGNASGGAVTRVLQIRLTRRYGAVSRTAQGQIQVRVPSGATDFGLGFEERFQGEGEPLQRASEDASSQRAARSQSGVRAADQSPGADQSP